MNMIEPIIQIDFGENNEYTGVIYVDRLWICKKVPVNQNCRDGLDPQWQICPDFHGWKNDQGWAWDGMGDNQNEYGNEPTLISAATIISSYIQVQIPGELIDALEAVVLSMRMKLGLMV